MKLLLFPEMMMLQQIKSKIYWMLARVFQGMLPALAPTGMSSFSSFLLASNVLDLPLPPYIFLTMMMIFLAMMMMIFLTKFLMIVLILILILFSYFLSLFQEFQAAEKMVVLQSYLVDLFPPDLLAWQQKVEEDQDEDHKQLRAGAPSLAWSACCPTQSSALLEQFHASSASLCWNMVKVLYSLESHSSAATCRPSTLCLSSWQLVMKMLLLLLMGRGVVMQMWMATSPVSLGIS